MATRLLSRAVKCLATAAAVAVVGMAGAASATTFDFTYTSTDGLQTATGTLHAYQVVPGEYEATSGTYSATGVVDSDTGALFKNPNGTAATISPSGFFIYDNQLLPTSDPLITNPGLLFIGMAGEEINIFSNGPGEGNYQFYSNTGANDFGSFTLTEVPEPVTWAMMLLGVAAIGVGLRLNRARQPEDLALT